MSRLVVIPSDPIRDYERAGYASWLEAYYNPEGLFDEVWALSPLERCERTAFGMHIRPVSWARFSREVASLRPQVVRAYGGSWPTVLACASRAHDIPVVISLHDTIEVHPAAAYADRVFCVSEVVRSLALRAGVAVERLAILPNRVDMALFHPLDRAGLHREFDARFRPGRRILHVGRKSSEKNLETVIHALARLPADYHAVFVGQGDAGRYCRIAEAAGVADRCFWVDRAPNEELPRWYNACDCLCVPSRHEGFGIVFIEAAACETPVVTSDIAPMNAYFVHGTSAHLVRAFDDSAALADAVRQVCENADYARRLGRAGREAVTCFGRPLVEQREASLYREAMAQPARSLTPADRRRLSCWRTGIRIRLARNRVHGILNRFRHPAHPPA